MSGAKIHLEMSPEMTQVNWTYDGKLKIQPRSFFVRPGLRYLHEAQSFALAAVLPQIALASDETITFEDPVPQEVISFWETKYASLQEFFPTRLGFRITPVTQDKVPRRRGTKTALFMGCGSDALSTLGELLDQGVRPHLVLIEEQKHTECYPGNIRSKMVKKLALDHGFDLSISYSDLWFFERHFLWARANHKHVMKTLKRGATMTAMDNIFRGFHMFFSGLAGLPEDIGTIVMGSSLEDRSEWCGMCFNYKNEAPYIDLALKTMPMDTKVAQFDFIHHKHPEFVPYMKSCVTPFKHWCGKCHACSISRAAQLGAGVKNPIEANFYPPYDTSARMMLKSARDYYKGNDPKVIAELNRRVAE